MELGLLGSVFNLRPSKGSPENIGSKVGVYPGDQASFCAVFSKLLCHFPQSSFFFPLSPRGVCTGAAHGRYCSGQDTKMSGS